MDIITTSLEALIQRATNVNNQGPDTAAIDAFCGLINKEPDCAQGAAKFITAKVHSLHEWEALQALLVLENCMKRCGVIFHAEVGKFRFLNELIKLVSPKYLGAHTPEPVRRRVLELMHQWTIHYPKETKIREAYDMLRKQGVVKDEPPPVAKETTYSKQHSSSILQDEEKSQLLQKLLQSKNPEDLQAANRLIKSMVKEDERRLEEKWRHTVELDTVVNNCRLLREMLDNYQPGISSTQDLELITELHTTCQSLRPVIFKLANNNSDPSFCNDVLSANDELGEVFTKYNSIIKGSPKPPPSSTSVAQTSQNMPSLLDLTPSPTQKIDSATNQLSQLGLDLSAPLPSSNNIKSNAESSSSKYLVSLDEIFNTQPAPIGPNQFISPSPFPPSKGEPPSKVNSGKSKGLEELDFLGESLLKESLSASSKLVAPVNKQNVKLPLNQMNHVGISAEPTIEKPTFLDDELIRDDEARLPESSDSLLDEPLLIEPEVQVTSEPSKEMPPPSIAALPPQAKKEKENVVLPLGDISVLLENIKPSSVQPYHALEEKNGISVILHLAKDCPRPDVSVFVVTTSNLSQSPVSSFLFQPVVPKCCRLRLLPPSSTSLPAHNPFLPPSAITQVMLIASAAKESIMLKFVISYTTNNETITEMGEISNLLLTEPVD